MTILPGLVLALLIAFAGQFLSRLIGIDLMGMEKSPISPIMMAILLGILIRNTIGLKDFFQPGVRFGLVRILRLGIVLLGIRLSLGEIGEIGLRSLPLIVVCVTSALLIVTYISKRLGLTGKLGILIAVGTSICGATAIVATAPAIGARDDEVSYAVACIALFGVSAMLVYPFAAHWIFAADPYSAGFFLGTAVHDTSQVVGSGLVYQQFYGDPEVLNVATVTKLVRNLGMLIVIPVMSIIYHRGTTTAGQTPKWWTMVPLFVIGFAAMSLFRTVGDIGDRAFGLLEPTTWAGLIKYSKSIAEICLAVAMASVGLGTSVKGLVDIGGKPLLVGLISALLVGAISVTMIVVFY